MQAKCALCVGWAVTRALITDISPARVSEIPAQAIRGSIVSLCGACAMLHCEGTIAGDGPPRHLPLLKESRGGKPCI
jgi:hypothetical protein